MYLAFDVGIKNLSYCLIDYNKSATSDAEKYKIIDWNIINLINSVEPEKKKCAYCKINAVYYKLDNKCLTICTKHSKEYKSDELLKITKKIVCSKPKCKKDARFFDKDNNYACGIHSKKMENKTEIFQQKATSIPLIQLSRSIFRELNKYPHFLDAVDIIIENQPVLKNPTMKSIQMVLYSYFISKETNGKKFNNMVLISASNKLKVYNGPKDEEIEKINKIKSKYTRNKKLAIEHCKKLVTDNKWLDFFNNFSKKDDLADAYLMCRYYLLKNK